MRKFGLAISLASVLVLSFGMSRAETMSAYYVASGYLPTGVVTSPSNSALTTFNPDGEHPKTPKSIKVADSAGMKGFAVDVCQNKEASNSNCDAGDAIFSYCSTGQTITIPASAGFTNEFPTSVYVNPDNATALRACAAGGHSLAGTITLTVG